MKAILSKQEIKDSIRYAALIQSAVMPDISILNKQIPGSFVLFRPRNIVSGDFYWFQRRKNRIAVVAADCTGHGVPGAFLSIMGINFLNLITASTIPPPHKILNQLREYVMKALKQEGCAIERKEGIDMTVCVFDLDNGNMEFSGAFTPVIYFHENNLFQLKPDRMPVGIGPVDEESFTRQIIPFSLMDILYMFSDGYPDQFGGKEEKKLKYTGFRNILSQIQSLPIQNQQSEISESLEQWMGRCEQTDDILVIGINIQSLKNETHSI